MDYSILIAVLVIIMCVAYAAFLYLAVATLPQLMDRVEKEYQELLAQPKIKKRIAVLKNKIPIPVKIGMGTVLRKSLKPAGY